MGTYGFGIIDWPQKEIDDLDVKTRKVLTMHKVIYRHQCMDRVYLPRREGGVGLIEINDALRSTIINLAQYVETTKDALLELVKKHHKKHLSENKSITKLATIFRKENNINVVEPEENIVCQEANENQDTAPVPQPKNVYTESERVKKRENWKNNNKGGNNKN